MSYIHAKRVELEEGEVSLDGAVHLELPDGEALVIWKVIF